MTPPRPRPTDAPERPGWLGPGWLAWWRRWWGARATAAPASPTDAPAARPRGLASAAAPTPRRQQRERVALLVRDIMIRHGVLSSRYRLRVLSLDREGWQHLVLIDWLPPAPARPLSEVAGPTPDLQRLEAQVREEAQQTLGLMVRAVYWRGTPAAGRPRRDGATDTTDRPAGGGVNAPRS
ncbi:MAG: hypothetical protein AB1371_07525 [Pseudomonadota bacterium]